MRTALVTAGALAAAIVHGMQAHVGEAEVQFGSNRVLANTAEGGGMGRFDRMAIFTGTAENSDAMRHAVAPAGALTCSDRGGHAGTCWRGRGARVG